MKKLSLLFLFVSVLFVSCSKDDAPVDTKSDDTKTNTSGDISGEWNLTKLYYTGENEISAGGQTIKMQFVGEGANYDCTLNFNETTKLVSSKGKYDINLEVTTNGDTQTSTQKDVAFETNGEWRRDGQFIYVENKQFGDEDKMEIKELTSSKLVLTGTVKRDAQGNGQVSTVNLEYTLGR